MSHIFFDQEQKYILAEDGKKCNDYKVEGRIKRNSGYVYYEPVTTLEDCDTALKWFEGSQTLQNIDNEVFNYANPSPRPYGCYFYTKFNYRRLVHPRRTTNDNSIPSESDMQQICKLKDIYQTDKNNEYILLNGLNGKTCDDIQNYDFIPCENENCVEECTKAYNYLSQQNINVRPTSSQEVIHSFSNPSPRPYGCYYFLPLKKVVFPTNTTKTNGIKSDKFKQQICKRINLERELNTPIDNTITYGVSDSPNPNADSLLQDTQENTTTQSEQNTNTQELIVPARKIPFCRIDKDVEQGQDIVVTQEIYVCPSGSSIFCPTNYAFKENIGCEWSSSDPEPQNEAPVPLCKPSETKVVITSVCANEELTEEECEGTSCIKDVNENCFCPEGVNITKRTCRKKIKQTEERVGVFDCGQYTLACPENYTLDNNTKYCILNK